MEQAFRFANEEYLWLLFTLPIGFLLFYFNRSFFQRKLRSWGNLQVVRRLIPMMSDFRAYVRLSLWLLAIAGIIIALARPQFGSKLTDVKRKGIELIIALDVSNSMMAEDILPNRLENAKLAISKLIDRLQNDKIGLIVFAGDAYVQLPITTDYSAAKLFLASINTQIVPRQGTSIKSAIDLGMKSFSPESDKNRSIVIITDGENHEEGAIEAAKAAGDQGVVVHTIGMGSAQGAPIPVYSGGGRSDFRTDHEGTVIITKLNEELLRMVADATGGMYTRASNSRTGLNAILDEIEKMEKKEIQAQVYSEYNEQFQYFTAFALFLLLIEMLLMNRKNKVLSRFFSIEQNKLKS